ncbi:MAG: hydrolase [Chlamydiae bacterium SM23_39]|nr:MAG: hydrolase [Chlamydiae bacterium SM23_39]
MEIEIKLNKEKLKGFLTIPLKAAGIILFAHGSGSSRFSKRNQFVANFFNKKGIATLLFDLLTEKEEAKDQYSYKFRFDIDLLSKRLIIATKWVEKNIKKLKIGYFGSSTGASAALIAASKIKNVKAIVSRGGRVDLSLKYIPNISAPTLLIIGGNDQVIIDLSKKAYEKLSCIKKIEIIEGAGHLFEENNALEKVAFLSANWFLKYLK